MTEWALSSALNVTLNASTLVPCSQTHHIAWRGAAVVSYVVGVLGNAVAAYILWSRHSVQRPRGNQKHALMLRCLVANDLLALLGMLALLCVCYVLPRDALSAYWTCVARVLWRAVGLCSGCVAAVMAMERWLALTHPFLYQKHVTLRVILLAIFCLWAHVLILACLPLLGFGLFIEGNTCMRYRMAKHPKHIAYAYLFFAFGTTLCFCIVWCNLAVVRALCHINMHHERSTRSQPILRRVSRRSMASTGSKCAALSDMESSHGPSVELETITLNVKQPSVDEEPCSNEQHGGNENKYDGHDLEMIVYANNSYRQLANSSSKKCIIRSTQCTSPESYSSTKTQCSPVSNEEVSFARLMTILSISFVVCWAPQMISILLAQFSMNSTPVCIFYKVADLLMALHFTLDPFVYVVFRHRQGQKRHGLPILKFLCRQCSHSSHTITERSENQEFIR